MMILPLATVFAENNVITEFDDVDDNELLIWIIFRFIKTWLVKFSVRDVATWENNEILDEYVVGGDNDDDVDDDDDEVGEESVKMMLLFSSSIR